MTALAFLAGGLCAQTADPPNDGEQNEAILVLLSGEVIQGKISQLDDRYLVVLPTGRIFVPVHTVEVVCRNLSEAYELRRSRIGHGQAQDHAELAQWCQRHGLDAAAQEQLQIARQLDPTHPIVSLVERRLAAAKLSPSGPPANEDAATEPTPQQLADFAVGLPLGTVEAFTRVVQPLLVNRCATSGCHTDRSENEFRLERSRPGTPLSQTATHRNLLATLKLVDSAAPDQCELLRPKRCPHRLRTDASVSLSKTGQYRFLVAWVSLVAHESANLRSAPVIAKHDLPDTIRTGPPERLPESSAATDNESPANRLIGAMEAPASPSVREAIAPTERMPSADPFDPAIFNGRYGTTASSEPAPMTENKIPAPNPFFAR